MRDFSKIVNLIWRVPAAIVWGGLGYYLVKVAAVWVLSTWAIYMQATDVVTFGTFVPLVVPLGALLWAFQEFIFPEEPPKQPPYGRYPQ